MRPNHHHHSGPPASAGMVRDPVCGMEVDPRSAPHHAHFSGADFHFCSAKCLQRFQSRPEMFVEAGRRVPASAESDVVYTCPMHPEIEQIGPGYCPICGMALEPRAFTPVEGASPEFLGMRRRFLVSAILTVPLALLVMLRHFWPASVETIGARSLDWVELAIATPVVLWGGWPFFVRGWRSLATRRLNMFTLIAIGTGIAWAYSVVGAVAPQIFPPALRDMHGGVGLYFEAAAVIVTLVLLGQLLELRARENPCRQRPPGSARRDQAKG